MSIQLTQDTWISGVKQTAGAALSLDASLEAQLVTDRKAIYTSTPVLNQADIDKHADEHESMGGPVLRYRLTGGAAGGVVQFSGTNQAGTVTVLDTFSLSANEVRTEVLWGEDSVAISYTVTSGAVTVEGY